MRRLSHLLRDDRGMTATEYGLVTVMIATIVGLALGPIAWHVQAGVHRVSAGFSDRGLADD